LLEYLATLLGMHEADGFISSAEAEEKRPKQVQSVPAPLICNLKDADKIRECLEKKFKDDQETHPEMLDPNWIKKS
jgi:hypothetical protein